MPKGKLKKASEDSRAAGIRKAVGASPDDEIVVSTSQRKRPPLGKRSRPVPAHDNERFFASLSMLTDEALQELGLRKRGRQYEGGPMLWLFPGEWYLRIPDGFVIVDINFNREPFKYGVTDNNNSTFTDGAACLTFGVLK